MKFLEVRILVGSFLDSHDLCSCVQVSKLWHETFLPFIYAQAKPVSFHPHWQSFQPQLRHVRDLSIIRVTKPHEKDGFLKKCRRLIRLHFASDPSPEAIDYLIRLLQRNQQLAQVSLLIAEGILYQSLWVVLVDGCSKLTEIELHSTNFQGAALNGFLNLAPRLTRLELDNCNLSQLLAWLSSPSSSSFGSFERQTNVYSCNENRVFDNKNWPGFPVLRELTLTGYYGDNIWMDQLQIFVRAPTLERLSWNIIDLRDPNAVHGTSEAFVSTLVRLLRQRPWPRLNSLEVTEDHLGRLSSLNGDHLAEILTLLPDGLKSFRFPGADFGLFAWQAIQRHLGTLEVLYLTKIPSWMAQGFLTSCPELRELHGPTLNTSDLVHGIEADLKWQHNAVAVAAMLDEGGQPKSLMTQLSLNPQTEGGCATSTSISAALVKDMNRSDLLEDQFPRPWVCYRLNVLRIKLPRKSKESNEERKKIDSRVFQQLSQLRYLRELFLCPLQDVHGVHGVHGSNPCLAFGIELEHPEFKGRFKNATTIRKHPVGKRLLEIWPGLTSCYLHSH